MLQSFADGVSWTANAAADELCCKLQTRYSKSYPLYSCYNVMLTKLYNVSVVSCYCMNGDVIKLK